MSTNLFSSYPLGDLQLQNRVVMAPMTRSRAIDNLPNELMAEYYGQRSGAGLIITEGTSPSPNGLGYPRIPGIFTEEQAAGWAKTTAAVHAGGAKIFVQLMHTGRVTHPANLPEGARVLAPSAVALEQSKMYVDGQGELAIPLAEVMSTTDIKAAIAEYVAAAELAISAGFDGVELHAANGYLIDQFLNPISNKREDEYGGNTEGRLRFLQEVTAAVIAAIGENRVGVRISPYGAFNELGAFDDVQATFVGAAELLSELDVAYLHLVDHSAMGAPEVPPAIKADLRKAFKNTFILSGGYDAETAAADLDADKGDLVAFGRPFLANPDLVARLEQGADLQQPDFSTFYTPGPEGYTDYAALS
ncbi:MAG: alkene reductase [Bacteroidota bacterium]